MKIKNTRNPSVNLGRAFILTIFQWSIHVSSHLYSFEILQPRAEKTIFELKNPVHVRDVSFIEEEDDTIAYHLWDKINELAGLKGKGATLRAVVKDLYGNEYTSNEINIDDFFI